MANAKFVFPAFFAVAGLVVYVGFFFSGESLSRERDDFKAADACRGFVSNKTDVISKARKRSGNIRARDIGKDGESVVGEENPYENISDEEMASFTEDQCIVLESLRRALDEENKSKIIQIVRNMQKSKGWEKSTPKVVKVEALEALDWIGVETLPEVAGFLNDEDKDISGAAIGSFERAVEDPDLGEKCRADILVIAAQVITDSEALESMFFELGGMDNSVAVAAIKRLWASANETAKALLPETVESITGEDDIATPEQLDAWLRENPD